MRIDAHQHFWRYDAVEYGWIDDTMAGLRRDFLPSDAEREMRRGGFDACVAVQARQTLEETRWLLSLAESYPFIAGVVGWLDLQAPDVRVQLEQLAGHPKLVGVRHIVQTEADDRFLLGPEFGRGIALLEEFGLAYDLLVYSRHLPVAAEFAGRFTGQRLVLDHLGKPDVRGGGIRGWSADVRRLAACPNVWCKLSGLVTEADLQPLREAATLGRAQFAEAFASAVTAKPALGLVAAIVLYRTLDPTLPHSAAAAAAL